MKEIKTSKSGPKIGIGSTKPWTDLPFFNIIYSETIAATLAEAFIGWKIRERRKSEVLT